MRDKKLIIGILIFGSVFLSGCGPQKTSTEILPTEPTAIPTKLPEVTAKEGPFLSLAPTSDGHWVNLEVKGIKKGTETLEYELTYFADVEGSQIERGESTGTSPIKLGGATEYSKKILFGSASCTTGTCKYKYDENVTEGMLTIKLNFSGEVGKYSSAFRIQRGKEAKDGFTTGDGVFSFVSANFPTNNIYLTISTIGIPSPLPAGVSIKSAPYAIFPLTSTKGTVSFKTNLVSAKMFLWDGQKWLSLETTSGNGILTAQTSKTGVFVLAE